MRRFPSFAYASNWRNEHGESRYSASQFFQPVLDQLDADGVNTAPIRRRSGLDHFDISRPDQFVPISAMYSFFDALRRTEGIDNLGDHFFRSLHMNNMADWGEFMVNTPDVLSLIHTAMLPENSILTNEQFHFDIHGANCTFGSSIEGPLGAGQEQTTQMIVVLTLNYLQLVCGEDWVPEEIHIQSEITPDLDALLPSGSKTLVYLGASSTRFVFPTAVLAMSVQDRYVKEKARPAPVPTTITGRIKYKKYKHPF